MSKIEISVSLPAYQSAFVTLPQQTHTVAFDLHRGTHIAQSEFINIGTIHGYEGKALLGQFSFEYTYEPDRDLITVCGTDFDSSGSMCLTTVPAETQEYCRQRSAGGGFVADDLMSNRHWNYVTALTPGLKDLFQAVVRNLNDVLIKALLDYPRLSVRIREQPPELSVEEQQPFLLVYRHGQFQGLHSADREYGVGYEVFTIQSVFGGTQTLALNTAFANVIGSTHDPKVDGETWIALWRRYFGPVSACTSYQFDGFCCSSRLLGGHVILGKVASGVDEGSDDVYIAPICQPHNNSNKVYMEALTNQRFIWLKNYMRS